jgi:protoporphyrinogen oxidase
VIVKWAAGHIGLAPDSTAFRVAEGTSRMPEGLIRLSEAKVKLNSLVTDISREGSFWNVHVADGDSEQFDMVVVSAPLSRANITFSGLNLRDSVESIQSPGSFVSPGVRANTDMYLFLSLLCARYLHDLDSCFTW